MGVLYRSGSLNNLTTADDDEMTALGITHVVDLRTAAERAAATDKLAPGTDYVVDDVLAGNPTLSNITAAATALISGSNKSSATVATGRRHSDRPLQGAAGPGHGQDGVQPAVHLGGDIAVRPGTGVPLHRG